MHSWGREPSSSDFRSPCTYAAQRKSLPSYFFWREKAFYSEVLLEGDRNAKMHLSASRKPVENNHKPQTDGEGKENVSNSCRLILSHAQPPS